MNGEMMFLLALAPIIWLMISLGVLKQAAHKTCFITFLATCALAVGVWKMPALQAVSAAAEGAAIALWPIMIVIVAAIFTYNLAVKTGSMDVIKRMLSGISTDRRIQVLILAWGFGGFLEAVAGYGTAVAIPASILASLGFNPVFAAIICLIANTVPTAFGAVGIPVTTLAKVTGLDVMDLSYAIGLQLTLFIVVIPFILVAMTSRSIKGLRGVMGITFASGLAFAVPQLLAAKYLGAELPALLGSICSMAVTIWMAKTFHKESAEKTDNPVSVREGVMAWLPYMLILLFILVSSPLLPPVAEFLGHFKSSFKIYSAENAAETSFKWIATPGFLIILATFIGGRIQGSRFSVMLKVLGDSAKQLSKSAMTVVSIVAMAKIMGYSGMITVIAAALVKGTGSFFPLISPLIGTLGTFVTGSDTSSNILFGSLQYEVAKSIGVDPVWLASANTSGATAGKMISPQSIAVATSATGLIGSEGKIFISTLKFCMIYVLALGILVYVGTLIG